MDENPRTSVPQNRLPAPEEAMCCSVGTARLLGDGATRRSRIPFLSAGALPVAALLVPAVLHGVADEGSEPLIGRD